MGSDSKPSASKKLVQCSTNIDTNHVENAHSLSYDETLKTQGDRYDIALQGVLETEPVNKLSKPMLQLYTICALMSLGATMGGFDGSLMGNMLAMPAFQHQFGTSISGAHTGFISRIYSIGSVSALPFVGPFTDKWGRRVGMMIGCVLVVLGVVIQGVSHKMPQYLAGRFFLGFGSGTFVYRGDRASCFQRCKGMLGDRCQAVYYYFFMVETKGRTLEELNRMTKSVEMGRDAGSM